MFKKKKNIYIISISLILVILYVLVGFKVQNSLYHPNTKSYEFWENIALRDGYYTEEFVENVKLEPVTIKSEYGYDLQGYFINNNSDKTMLISHGLTENIKGALRWAPMYQELGFNIFVYDHRNHGKSGGTNTTFGYYEKNDQAKVLEYLRERMGKNSIIGIHGGSMGTGILLQYQGKYHGADFVIAECGFKSLNTLIDAQDLKYITPIASLINKLRGCEFYYKISPLEAVKNIEKPVYFIHGDKDEQVPYQHSIDMYNAKTKGYKKLYISKGSKHMTANVEDTEQYLIEMKKFLNDIGIIKENNN